MMNLESDCTYRPKISSHPAVERAKWCMYIFVAFVDDNATMNSILYFENHISYLIYSKPKEVDPIKLISLQEISLSIALKYIINNSV